VKNVPSVAVAEQVAPVDMGRTLTEPAWDVPMAPHDVLGTTFMDFIVQLESE
jgi:hypothetical protein